MAEKVKQISKKSIADHVNQWVQWGYNTLKEHPIKTLISAIAGVLGIKWTFGGAGKAGTKDPDPSTKKDDGAGPKKGLDKTQQDALRKLEDTLKQSNKPSGDKHDEDDKGGMPKPPGTKAAVTRSSSGGDLLVPNDDDDRHEEAASAIVPMATISDGNLVINTEGGTVTIPLSELEDLPIDSPLLSLLAQAQGVAQLTIMNDGTTTQIDKVDDEGKEKEGEEVDGTMGGRQQSHLGADEEEQGDPQQSHLHGDPVPGAGGGLLDDSQ